jgi:hypothetical protein
VLELEIEELQHELKEDLQLEEVLVGADKMLTLEEDDVVERVEVLKGAEWIVVLERVENVEELTGAE